MQHQRQHRSHTNIPVEEEESQGNQKAMYVKNVTYLEVYLYVLSVYLHLIVYPTSYYTLIHTYTIEVFLLEHDP